jgi:hypothetical protein
VVGVVMVLVLMVGGLVEVLVLLVLVVGVGVELVAEVVGVRVELGCRGVVGRDGGRWGWSLAAWQALGEDAEDDDAVGGGVARYVFAREVLERGDVLGLERARVGRERVGPVVCRGGLPRLGGAAEKGDRLHHAADLAVLRAPLLLVNGGVAVDEEARGEEATARLGVDPAAPPVLEGGKALLLDGEQGMVQEGRVLRQDLLV